MRNSVELIVPETLGGIPRPDSDHIGPKKTKRQNDSVQGRLTARVLQIGSDEYFGFGFWLYVGNFGHGLDERNVELAEDTVSRRPPELLLVLEMIGNQRVVDAGIASPEEVNQLMTDCFNWPVGPFAMIQGATSGWKQE